MHKFARIREGAAQYAKRDWQPTSAWQRQPGPDRSRAIKREESSMPWEGYRHVVGQDVGCVGWCDGIGRSQKAGCSHLVVPVEQFVAQTDINDLPE